MPYPQPMVTISLSEYLELKKKENDLKLNPKEKEDIKVIALKFHSFINNQIYLAHSPMPKDLEGMASMFADIVAEGGEK